MAYIAEHSSVLVLRLVSNQPMPACISAPYVTAQLGAAQPAVHRVGAVVADAVPESSRDVHWQNPGPSNVQEGRRDPGLKTLPGRKRAHPGACADKWLLSNVDPWGATVRVDRQIITRRDPAWVLF